MTRSNRAKQFMPFDALKGFREALAEKERIIVSPRILSEEQKEELDFRLRRIGKENQVTAEYYHNGEYVKITGPVSDIDCVHRVLKIQDTEISFDDITCLQQEQGV